MKVLSRLTNAFPLWVLLASLLALYQPAWFTWFSGALIPLGLGMIMLGMGLTLTVDDFRGVLKFPGWVLTGVALQYTVMPLCGWAIGLLFQLSPEYAVGLVLVSCCPGGTASNVVSYLGRLDVPLSVTLTAVSTFLAALLTPMLTLFFADNRLEVNGAGLFLSTFQVVILPVTTGVLINRFCHRWAARVLPAAPLVSVMFITLIVASIVEAGREAILHSAGRLMGAVFLLHVCGFLLGYLMGKGLTRRERTARTISIEVGMQNSGLGVVLARANFANPAVAIPSALSSVFHSLIGSALAAWWRGRPELS